MKKLIILLALVFVMHGCNNYESSGPEMPFPIEKGSVRTTETSDYIATEVCVYVNGIEKTVPVWRLVEVKKKK